MANPMPVLEVQDAWLGYGPTPVAGPVTLALHPGERLALLGPNGVGKSTLLKAVLGEAQVLQGTLRLAPGTRLGVVPQTGVIDLLLPTTVGEFLGIAARCEPGGAARLAELRSAWELGDLWRSQLRLFSGGQQQRVLLVRALLRDPHLLLLDEPTAGLDVAMQAQFCSALQQLPPTTAVLLVTHELALVAALGARTLTLEREVQR